MTGSSVVLAYFLASLLAVPAALSIAELSTAMPRAGGIYYFLDRSLGPMVGTIGGLGTWLVLVLKSAFALVGMGAYLVLFIHLPIRTVAIVLTLVFALVNVVGAKHTGGLQRVLVSPWPSPGNHLRILWRISSHGSPRRSSWTSGCPFRTSRDSRKPFCASNAFSR